MCGKQILVVSGCRDVRNELVRHLESSGDSLDISQVACVEDMAPYMTAPRPELVIVHCAFGKEGALEFGPCRAVRALDPCRRLGLLVIATGLAVGRECRAATAGADACLRAEDLTRLRLQDTSRDVLAMAEERRLGCREAGPLLFVRDDRTMHRGSEVIEFSEPQFSVLWALAGAPGAVVDASRLLAMRAREAPARFSGRLRQVIRRLRRKLGRLGILVRSVGRGAYTLDVASAKALAALGAAA